jgi:osmotically-inducible protein OsmY
MRTDSDIRRDVEQELDSDPKIGSRDIAVSVRNGVVTLAGFVRSFGEKAQAETDARRVAGVVGLANDIEVRLPLFGGKPDPEIAREVVARIQSEMPALREQIRVRVADGRVTLEGEVESHEQRAIVEDLTRTVKGIKRISNDIVVKSPILPLEIKHRIEIAFERGAEIDADSITVEIGANGTIILGGSVRSWAEREEAERAASSASGVQKIDNRLQVVTQESY